MKERLFDNDFFVTDIVLACFVAPGTGTPVHRNRPSHGFAYNIGGTKYYRFGDGTTIPVNENELIYLPRFSDYTVETVTDNGCYAINFLLDAPGAAAPFKLPLRPEKVLPSFQNAERAFRLQQYDYREQCCKELYEIACCIKQAQSGQNYLSGRQDAVLAVAKAYILSRYTTETISVPLLAAHCGVSEVYLRRIFHTAFQMSPTAYVNHLRLSYARSLLTSGEYSVSEVCGISGFNDASYFCRAYKRKYGFPPRSETR